MQEKNYSIKKWAKDDQPREKALSKSTKALSDSELLAILIQNGNKEKSAVEIGREVLRLGNNSLVELSKLSIQELMKIKGIGVVKALKITAVFEIARRREAIRPVDKPVLKNSKDVADFLQISLKDLQYEAFAVIFLNQANRINHFEILSNGGITATVADPRIILRRALEESAVSLILCHNHPSGSLKPSKADEELTFKIKEAARYHDISIFDHIIVSEAGYFSFADEGML